MSNIIDLTVIDGLKEIGDQEFLNELIEMFLQQSDTLVDDIKKFSDSNDGDSLSKSAHKLKGSCLNLGAHKMSEICQILENKGRENNLENINQDVKDLLDVYVITNSELRKLM